MHNLIAIERRGREGGGKGQQKRNETELGRDR